MRKLDTCGWRKKHVCRSAYLHLGCVKTITICPRGNKRNVGQAFEDNGGDRENRVVEMMDK